MSVYQTATVRVVVKISVIFGLMLHMLHALNMSP